MNEFPGWIAASVMLMTSLTPVQAQLPAGCSSADQKRTDSFTQAAVEALKKGDTDRYLSLTRDLESGLSTECRAAVARWEPARERCTSPERKLVLNNYVGMINALTKKNPQRFIGLYDNTEASVAQGCWLAVNQPTHPTIRQACSAAELDVMASFAGPIIRALARGDPDEGLQLTQSMAGQVAPKCRTAFMEVANKPTPTSGQPQPLPNVNDHGNGTYSVHGVGACTPSGCIAF